MVNGRCVLRRRCVRSQEGDEPRGDRLSRAARSTVGGVSVDERHRRFGENQGLIVSEIARPSKLGFPSLDRKKTPDSKRGKSRRGAPFSRARRAEPHRQSYHGACPAPSCFTTRRRPRSQPRARLAPSAMPRCRAFSRGGLPRRGSLGFSVPDARRRARRRARSRPGRAWHGGEEVPLVPDRVIRASRFPSARSPGAHGRRDDDVIARRAPWRCAAGPRRAGAPYIGAAAGSRPRVSTADAPCGNIQHVAPVRARSRPARTRARRRRRARYRARSRKP
jgi:hypothetical protein